MLEMIIRVVMEKEYQCDKVVLPRSLFSIYVAVAVWHHFSY